MRTIIIPARLLSTRLANKVLLEHQGQSLIVRVIKSAQKVPEAQVVVATEDKEIYEHVQNHCPEVLLMRTPRCQSGTERSLYVAKKLKLKDPFVSWQADEPYLKPEWIDFLLSYCNQNSAIGTCVFKNSSLDDFLSPSAVKAVLREDKQVLYFSRAPIPCHKLQDYSQNLPFYHHLGLYAFSPDMIDFLAQQSPQALAFAQKEDLEQLAWLYQGLDVYAHEVQCDNVFGIDTLEDWEKYCNYEEELEKQLTHQSSNKTVFTD